MRTTTLHSFLFFLGRSMWLCFDLVDDGYLTSDQAMKILRRQMSCRTPIGQLAVEHEMLTMGQVFDVLAKQFESDLPFGELAIEMGYLSREQLGDLILRQLDSVPSQAELLVKTGMLSEQELGKAIQARRHRRMGAAQELELLDAC